MGVMGEDVEGPLSTGEEHSNGEVNGVGHVYRDGDGPMELD